MKPKISIIVPIYKVEQYLEKCIDSILAQTFEEFELILVNDGSPDKCGEICNKYLIKDKRIRVIHKENGGQSSARNTGLDIAQGEYIGFVDSDDWIEPQMYETLYNLCLKNNSEISVISSNIIYPKRKIQRENSSLKVFSREEAMRELIRGRFYDEVVWTKLFKKEIIGDIRYKEDIKYEDTEFTYRVINNCNKLSYEGKGLYNYLIREGSTMHIAAKEISIDYIFIYDEMYKFYNQFYSKYSYMVLERMLDTSLNILNKIIKSEPSKENSFKFNKTRDMLNKYFFKFIFLKKVNKNIKILLAFLKLNSLIYIFVVNRISKK